jgi:uncharacterized protein
MSNWLLEKREKVYCLLQELSPVIVAFSGGTDSTLVLKLAVDALGAGNVLAATGKSPSIPIEEQNEAYKLAKQIGANHIFIETHELENEAYAANPSNRCYFCKNELFSRLETLRIEKGYKTIVDGTNADDVHDWRPGMKAAQVHGVRSPLLEAGFTKREIRLISRQLGLPTWDKPAMPCLSSRIPYGEAITPERLKRIHDAESVLRQAGFRDVRVRDHFPIARIEVLHGEMQKLVEEPLRTEIASRLKKLGYLFITLDLLGLQSGSLNQVLAIETSPKV